MGKNDKIEKNTSTASISWDFVPSSQRKIVVVKGQTGWKRISFLPSIEYQESIYYKLRKSLTFSFLIWFITIEWCRNIDVSWRG